MRLLETPYLVLIIVIKLRFSKSLSGPLCSPKSNIIGPDPLHSTINYIQQDKGLHVLLSFEDSSSNCSIRLTFPNAESRYFTLRNNSDELSGWKLIRDTKYHHIARLINENEKSVKEGFYKITLNRSRSLDFYALKKRKPYFKTEKERLDNKTYLIKVNLGFHTCLFYNEHFPSTNGSNIEVICDKKRKCSPHEVSFEASKFYKYYKVTVHNETLTNASLVCFITNFPDETRTWYSKLSWPVNEVIEPKKVQLKVDHPIVLIVMLSLSCIILLFAMLVIAANRIKNSSKNGAIQTFIVTNEEELDLQSSSGTTAAMIMGGGRPRLLSLQSTTSTYISNNTLVSSGNQFLAVPTTAIIAHGDHQIEISKIDEEPLFKDRFTDFNNLDMNNVIGEGNFGRVKAAILRDFGACWEVAVKYIKSNGSVDSFEQRELIKEAKTMLKIGYHPNIVNLQRVTMDRAGTFYLILEYCSNDSLLKYLRLERQRYKEALAFETYKGYIQDGNNKCNEDVNTMISWGFQIASGMSFLYERDVIQLHGDLAARNILLTTDLTAKISDFGLSHRLYNHYVTSDMRTDVLPSRWMAPEALRDIKLSKYTDLWSFGIVIWEIFSLGETPYSSIRGDNINKLLLETFSSGQRLMTPLHTPGEIDTLMNDCWNSVPSLRPTFSTLMGRLERLLSPAYRRREQALNDAMWTQYSKICNKMYFQMSSSQKLDEEKEAAECEYTPKSRSSYLRIDK
ncbi:uncharacterized protein [Lepeophtheirus salmonis]|uniref:uncharacterized protein n=1 Tax=Lepeophtheirus salmonis TaxID=72036 RepID=UPI001AE7E298|nr:fibroblast growth factor receptor 1-A-like [Lepeophtheirus salmonis]